MQKNSLYWFTQDLRIHDNAALEAAKQSDSLVCIYIVEPRWFSAQRWQHASMGPNRWNFLQECLSDLAQSLHSLGQRLHVYYGDPEVIVPQLCQTYAINHLLCMRRAGSDEQASLSRIKRQLPTVKLERVDQYTLFNSNELPIPLAQWPMQYTHFRQHAEVCDIKRASGAPSSLPPMPTLFALPSIERPSWLPTPTSNQNAFKGGESPARQHLDEYFKGALPANYKKVRNEIDGWGNSSKFSPWLNQGCVSPRQVKAMITNYEQAITQNESTHWLFFELLWREYFQWLHHRIGAKLFHFKGLADSPPLTSYYAERFQKWCYGETPYRLVNACAKELKATGYLSNRGRQIMASCLVNELSVDWRYGAAWFEHQLIDYDVAVNWGNWQYIAGVGVDPRGGRHFNIEKQTSLYDADGRYQSNWQADARAQLDSVDAADWPIHDPLPLQ